MNKPRVPGIKSNVYIWRDTVDPDVIHLGVWFDGFPITSWATMGIDAAHYLFGKEESGIIKTLKSGVPQNVILSMEFIP